ncbi:hypothetical protein AeRB84_017485 [Aphanomyces euteiches]|nr:hypothetical protein AeRB84_017485 [Aphanomyces euteiches]
MYNVVHIDEKWFYITKLRRRHYLWHEETPPPRYLHTKAHISKVMFFVAVARPRKDWDGKVGCWPLIESTVAKRNSRNRVAGSPVLSTLTVTRDLYRKYLVEKVFPAIKSKWTWLDEDAVNDVFLQQDNARPHVRVDDPVITAAGESDGWSIKIINQPPKSPDLNALDLGFFNAIQAIQQSMECQSIEDLVDAVVRSFDQLSSSTLDKTFKTLRRVIGTCLEAGGGNSYKILRSKGSEDDAKALELLNLRLEEEDRMEELACLFESSVAITPQ